MSAGSTGFARAQEAIPQMRSGSRSQTAARAHVLMPSLTFLYADKYSGGLPLEQPFKRLARAIHKLVRAVPQVLDSDER